MWPQAQENLEPPRQWKSLEGPSPGASGGTLGFGLQDSTLGG
jgi:hypothetical protein